MRFKGADFKHNSYKIWVKRKSIQGQKYDLPRITVTILQGLAPITKYDEFVLVTTVLSYQKKVGSYEPTLYHCHTVLA